MTRTEDTDVQDRRILKTQPGDGEAEYRPNPIAMTTCKILAVDEENGIVQIADIDAYDGTPIVDLKAYFPVCDRVKDARIPEWLSDWPEWMPEEGLGLEY